MVLTSADHADVGDTSDDAVEDMEGEEARRAGKGESQPTTRTQKFLAMTGTKR